MRVSLVGCCVLLTGLAIAAPAPLPPRVRYDNAGMWFAGWGNPVDPLGGCRFERRLGRLRICVPGGKRSMWVGNGESNLEAPRLLREVRGDFSASVCVQLDELATHKDGFRKAGIVLLPGEKQCAQIHVRYNTDRKRWIVDSHFENPNRHHGIESGLDVSPETLHLRLERRGHKVQLSYSLDGKKWHDQTPGNDFLKMPDTVQFGVFVESEGSGAFQVRFGQFRLITK